MSKDEITGDLIEVKPDLDLESIIKGVNSVGIRPFVSEALRYIKQDSPYGLIQVIGQGVEYVRQKNLGKEPLDTLFDLFVQGQEMYVNRARKCLDVRNTENFESMLRALNHIRTRAPDKFTTQKELADVVATYYSTQFVSAIEDRAQDGIITDDEKRKLGLLAQEYQTQAKKYGIRLYLVSQLETIPEYVEPSIGSMDLKVALNKIKGED